MEREKQIYRVTVVGGIANLLLVAVKFVAGIAGRSAAMIADAVHSLSDFITDIVVLVFVGISAKPQDASHDYGHGKFETIATFFIALALAAAAIGIVVSGATKLAAWVQGEDIPAPGMLALWAALISIVVKEILYQYTARKGKKLESQALVANAWHHRSDALSSIGAAIGIGGAILLGNRWTVLDPLASIVVGAMLVKVAWDLLGPCIGELTDKSLPEETENEILGIIACVDGVRDPHNLRTRRIGNRVAIEVHVRMAGDTTLHVSHEKATEIEHLLRNRFGDNAHITIHMEPIK